VRDVDLIDREEHDVAQPPEELAPDRGTVLNEQDLAARFGIDDLAPRSGRHGGHLFVFIESAGVLTSPDRLRYEPVPRRPGETAFVLSKHDPNHWRYLGVARQLQNDSAWQLPEVDLATWRLWGDGKTVSRRVSDTALARAQLAVVALLALPEERRWIEQAGPKRARIVGPAARGGLRLDGGDGGFAERTVSLQDIAWAIVAGENVRANGGLLDEERVNRLRYLEGTPKGSTRWIDTGWALAAWSLARGLMSNSR